MHKTVFVFHFTRLQLVEIISMKQRSPAFVSLSLYQAAINAMNLEQQLSQYAFFNQQPSSQNQQRQQVGFVSCKQQKEE